MDGTQPMVDRAASCVWFRSTRERTAGLFDLLTPEAYYERPIPLRHPVVFYEGHIPAFTVNTLLKRGLGRQGLDEHLERLFARGIDPEEQKLADEAAITEWPTRERVQDYVAGADAAILDVLEHGELERDGHPVLHRGQAVFTAIEHEELHQETLAYMWHRLPFAQKRRPPVLRTVVGGAAPAADRVLISAGVATLGATPAEIQFGWANEFAERQVPVPAFVIDRHNVTNEQFLDFVEAEGYNDSRWWSDVDWQWRTQAGVEHPAYWTRDTGDWCWRGMFEVIPLPPSWPVYVTHAEASAYARWAGRRLPTEAEYHRAAFGTPDGSERCYPWGDERPDLTRGNFGFQGWDPLPVGSHPAGASAWGVYDLVGNGWEWTSTLFEPFAGFSPMASYPEYSADFFDGCHYVLKGASPFTALGLVRRSFRNWFRPHYPFVCAGFRCVGEAR